MDRLAGRVSRALALASSVAVLAITLAIVVDVIGRFLWAAPLAGASEFAVTAMIAVVFLGLARAQRIGGNFRVDFLVRLLPERLGRLLEVLWRVAAAALIGLFCWLSIREAIHATIIGEATFGTVAFVVWPARIILALGFCVLLLQIVVEIVRLCMGLTPTDEQSTPISAE